MPTTTASNPSGASCAWASTGVHAARFERLEDPRTADHQRPFTRLEQLGGSHRRGEHGALRRYPHGVERLLLARDRVAGVVRDEQHGRARSPQPGDACVRARDRVVRQPHDPVQIAQDQRVAVHDRRCSHTLRRVPTWRRAPIRAVPSAALRTQHRPPARRRAALRRAVRGRPRRLGRARRAQHRARRRASRGGGHRPLREPPPNGSRLGSARARSSRTRHRR